MAEKDETADTPIPSPRLERVVGIITKSTVLTLIPIWAVWVLTDMGSFPTWVWVLTPACPAVFFSMLTSLRLRTRESTMDSADPSEAP